MAKVRVLIIEKEFIISQDLQYRLKAMGYCVLNDIRFGEEAVEAVSRVHPDVVLIEIGLSGLMDGIVTGAEIGRRFNIPVIYLTGYDDETTIDQAKTPQPSGFILKPFNDDELRAGIETAIHSTGR